MQSIDVSSHTLCDFAYDPLPNAHSIRILEIGTEPGCLQVSSEPDDTFDPEDVVVCKLHTVGLNLSESYDALSYTWGDPLSVYQSKEDAERASRTHKIKVPIICNDRILEVGVNLYNALSLLRTYLRGPAYTLDKLHPDFEARPFVQRYIWIDAICIDQGNVTERNLQVQIMDKIYRGAGAVIIWLGPEDAFSRSAVSTLTVLGNTPVELAKDLVLSDRLFPKREMPPEMPRITSAQWLHVFAFLERHWFRRAWIVQETALAKVGIVLCGSLVLPWTTLVRAVYWLRESLSYPIIWNEGLTRSLELFTPESGMYRPASEHQGHDAVATIFGLANVRGGLGLKDVGMLLKDTRSLVKPLALLSTFRASKCLDPRDKIYALLSLWPEQVEAGSTENSMVVDYARPVPQVYMDAARYILHSSCNLRILSHVDARMRMPGLPSWAPNWSQGTTWKPFDTQVWLEESKHVKSGDIPFSATGDYQWEPTKSFSQDSHLLAANGKKIGTIRVTAPTNTNDVAQMLPVLNEIPVMYPYFKVSPIEEDDPLIGVSLESPMPDSLTQRFHYLIHDKDDEEHRRTPRNVASEGPSQAARTVTEAHKIIDMCQQTRFEALWRTLIADVWKFKHPAPLQAGFALAASLVDDMHELIRRTQRVNNKESIIHPHGVTGLILDVSTSMMEGGGTSIEEVDRKWRKRITILQALAKDEAMCLSHYEEGESHDEPQRFLPDIETSDDIMAYDINLEAVKAWRAFQRPGRLLFATSTHKIGLGPLPTKVDDEVWILSGARFPFILRPLENGHHEVVGEAYVHGIMHGEALWFGDQTWSEVILE